MLNVNLPTCSSALPRPRVWPQAASAALAADGKLSVVTVTQPGGGYIAAPQILLIPSPSDANVGVGRIKDATATASLVGEGTVTAALLESFGAPLDAALELKLSASVK